MRPSLLTSLAGGLFFTCVLLTAHPGDSGYWLIEVDCQYVRSRILFPGHLLDHLPGLDLNQDGIVDRAEVVESEGKIISAIRERLLVVGESRPLRVQSEELLLESSGFVEVLTSYFRPQGLRNLKASSSLDQLFGSDQVFLCRVIGGRPEHFELNSQTGSSEIVLAIVPPAKETTGSPSHSWFDSLNSSLGRILFLVIGLSALGLLPALLTAK